MDSQDKDKKKKEDFYSQGVPHGPRDFTRPPPPIVQQQQQMDAEVPAEEQIRRVMECNRRAFGFEFMRHSYLFDGATGESAGKGNLNTPEQGPVTDPCYWLPGSLQQQMAAMRRQQHAVKTEEGQPNGLPFQDGVRSFFPGYQDCHTMKDHSARSEGIPSYTSRFGEHNTRPKVSKEDWKKEWMKQCMKGRQLDPTCKPFDDFFKKRDPRDPGTGGGDGVKV